MSSCRHAWHRREFVRSLSLGLAALPVLGREGLAQALTAHRSRVALVRTSDRRHGVTQALNLDSHGKTLSFRMLELTVAVPDDLVHFAKS